MKDLLIQIVKALVDNPEQVQVNEIEGTQTVILELRVAKSDMGKIIGKQGKTANAIRTLLIAVSGKTRRRYLLKIVEWCGGSDLWEDGLDLTAVICDICKSIVVVNGGDTGKIHGIYDTTYFQWSIPLINTAKLRINIWNLKYFIIWHKTIFIILNLI